MAKPLRIEVQATSETRARGRALRSDASVPERVLWSRLRRGHLKGLKFRRQHALGPFIADFYCHECALVVEVDGSQHQGEQKSYDARRDRWMEDRGLLVLRFSAADVCNETEAVVRTIAREATLRKTPSASEDLGTSPTGSG
ncbi:MAG: endonuclease domain-containing protein, partial [Phycisphaerales bacterium]|nr:endonuclease domain-containing protein [Phycisphaerales bacterium]